MAREGRDGGTSWSKSVVKRTWMAVMAKVERGWGVGCARHRRWTRKRVCGGAHGDDGLSCFQRSPSRQSSSCSTLFTFIMSSHQHEN